MNEAFDSEITAMFNNAAKNNIKAITEKDF